MTGNRELLDTIEQLRSQKFPELPVELVEQIVAVEIAFTENRQESYKRISQIIDSYLNDRSSVQHEGG